MAITIEYKPLVAVTKPSIMLSSRPTLPITKEQKSPIPGEEQVESLDKLKNLSAYTRKIFQEKGEKGLYSYLNTRQMYTVASSASMWSPPKGELGNHAVIMLPGSRVCEWSPRPFVPGTPLTQLEARFATGREIERIWQTHLTLSPKYQKIGSIGSFPEGLIHYVPGTNDCWSYCDSVLVRSGQPRATQGLVRMTPTIISKAVLCFAQCFPH